MSVQQEIGGNKGVNMNYKKPQIVAKSAAKQSYAAGCPAKQYNPAFKSGNCRACEISGK